MKKFFAWVPICTMVAVGLIACGGGGGSSLIPQKQIPLKTSTLRTLQAGDSWTYGKLSGTMVEGLDSTPSATVHLTGTIISAITSSVVTSPTASIDCKVQDDYTVLSDGSSTVVDSHDFTYFAQFSTGIYKCGDYTPGDLAHWITTPPSYDRLEIGSPVSVGTATSISTTDSSGVAETRSYTVVAKEYVAIGKTDYESYKIVSTVTTTYNGAQFESQTTNRTSWLVPGLGFVKEHRTEFVYDTGHALYGILDLTETLTETNVPY
jgi:hypothetical protein